MDKASIPLVVLTLLLLIPLGMALISLFSPRIGLFFAHAAQRTTMRGIIFWLAVSLCIFEILGIAHDLTKGRTSPPVMYILTFFLVAFCSHALFKMRKPPK